MREIKFRFYDKFDKKMFNIDNLGFDDWLTTTIHSMNDCRVLSLGGDGYPIMQYTGLKDKEGNLIFEGDLYKIKSHLKTNIGNGIEVIETYFLCKIVFDLGGFCGEIIKCNWINREEEFYKNAHNDWKNENLGKKLSLPIYEIDNYVFKNDIIGNIYENDLIDK